MLFEFFAFAIVIIYLAWQILKRWGRLARHDTFNAIMAAIVAWAAIAGIVAFLAPEGYKATIGVVFTVGFVICTGTYFYSDYRKMHKKPKPKIKFPPLSTETVEPTKPVTKVRTKRAIARAVFFVMLETVEAVFFISVIVTWETFTINNIPVLTYQNMILLGFLILGLVLAIDLTRRLRSKKALFGDE